MKVNKYIYYQTIQEQYGKIWESVDFHECNSAGTMTTKNRALFKENKKAYLENSPQPIRVVVTKEANPAYQVIMKQFKGDNGAELILYKSSKGYFVTEPDAKWNREFITKANMMDDKGAIFYIDDIAHHSPHKYKEVKL